MADNDLAGSVSGMSDTLTGGPLVRAASNVGAVATSAANAVHKVVGRMNETDRTDGSSKIPTVQANLPDQDWSKLNNAPNNMGRKNK